MFGKLDDTQNINSIGVGLGLAVSKALCIEMGGDITVESEYG